MFCKEESLSFLTQCVKVRQEERWRSTPFLVFLGKHNREQRNKQDQDSKRFYLFVIVLIYNMEQTIVQVPIILFLVQKKTLSPLLKSLSPQKQAILHLRISLPIVTVLLLLSRSLSCGYHITCTSWIFILYWISLLRLLFCILGTRFFI